MRRCNNVKISADNIQQVADQAQDLLRAVTELQFVMTLQEQQGLYSLIDALDWEVIQHQIEPDSRRPESGRERLRALLEQVRAQPHDSTSED